MCCIVINPPVCRRKENKSITNDDNNNSYCPVTIRKKKKTRSSTSKYIGEVKLQIRATENIYFWLPLNRKSFWTNLIGSESVSWFSVYRIINKENGTTDLYPSISIRRVLYPQIYLESIKTKSENPSEPPPQINLIYSQFTYALKEELYNYCRDIS